MRTKSPGSAEETLAAKRDTPVTIGCLHLGGPDSNLVGNVPGISVRLLAIQSVPWSTERIVGGGLVRFRE